MSESDNRDRDDALRALEDEVEILRRWLDTEGRNYPPAHKVDDLLAASYRRVP